MAGLDNITVVCAAGEANGGFFGTLGQMVQRYEAQGADFSAKKNYDRGLWNSTMVKMAVGKGVITKEQYEEITGKKYA